MALELAPLLEPHPFRWKDVELEPKVIRCCLHRFHRTMEYEILHTGGFLRLCTERGRVYWMAQNEHDHCLPDWKLHFSVSPAHVPRAWDVLTQVFMEKACDFGMKAVAQEALETWPAHQRGREITVYIFQNHPAYTGGGPMMDCCDPDTAYRFWLGCEFERPSSFWHDLVRDAEAALHKAGIESHGGTAIGDLPLDGLGYASLRNEAFIPIQENSGRHGCRHTVYVYPPNSAGWNAAGHRSPLELQWQLRFRFLIAALISMCCQRRCRAPPTKAKED